MGGRKCSCIFDIEKLGNQILCVAKERSLSLGGKGNHNSRDRLGNFAFTSFLGFKQSQSPEKDLMLPSSRISSWNFQWDSFVGY